MLPIDHRAIDPYLPSLQVLGYVSAVVAERDVWEGMSCRGDGTLFVKGLHEGLGERGPASDR